MKREQALEEYGSLDGVRACRACESWLAEDLIGKCERCDEDCCEDCTATQKDRHSIRADREVCGECADALGLTTNAERVR